MHNAVEILLVEDNDFDVEALKRAFRKAEIANRVHSAVDGVDALGKLQGPIENTPIRQPLLILLDINMPRMDGFEFLDALRNDEKHKQSVVFMLTTSGHDRDRQMAYSRHVAGYFLKENLDDLVDTVKAYVRGNEFPQAGSAANFN
jgi:CheY-like chemotaxis protein